MRSYEIYSRQKRGKDSLSRAADQFLIAQLAINAMEHETNRAYDLFKH
jgi:hypothetical protein